jgi:hypothetical protein
MRGFSRVGHPNQQAPTRTPVRTALASETLQFMGQPSLAGVVICIAGKAQQQVAFALEPEAQGPALGQLGTHARSHHVPHRWRRGQGSAAYRSYSKCTLAYDAVIFAERWPKTSAICLRSAPR